MPTYKLTFQFVENNGSAFSEIYYVNSDNAADAINLTNGGVQVSRLNLLHPLNNLQRIRAANIAGGRDTAHVVYNTPGTSPAVGGPLPVGAAAILQLGSSAGGQRKMWLRGLPSNWYVRSGITGLDLPPNAFQQQLNSYFTALANAGLGMVRLTPVGQGFVQKIQLTQIDGTAANGVATVTTAVPHGFLPGQNIIIGRASKKDLPALNGKYTLISLPTLTTFQIAYNTPSGKLVMANGAYAKLNIPIGSNQFNFNLCSFDHYGTRTSRAPLFNSRGAKRAARLRLSL